MTLYKIVLGGNSNCGKTELLPKLTKYLQDRGYHVIQVPESATELLNAGLVPGEDFQVHVARKQRVNEDNQTISAWKHMTKHPNQDIVMLLDRSFLCQRAYTHDLQTWVNILNKTFNRNYSCREMINYISKRYDGVIHMESNLKFGHVAEGRIETLEEALALEEKVLEANKMCKVFKYVSRQEKMSDKLRLVEKACISIINNKE